MFYDKKIKYLDYCENGARISGGGFARTEVKEKDFKLYLNVRGLRLGGTVAAKVLLCGKEDEVALGQITLENGQGEFRHECQFETEGVKFSFEEVTGIRILLGDDRELKCGWAKELAVRAPETGKRSEAEQSAVVGSRTEPGEPPAEKMPSGGQEPPAAKGTSEMQGASAAKGLPGGQEAPAAKGLSEMQGASAAKGLPGGQEPPAAKGTSEMQGASAAKGLPGGQEPPAPEARSKAEQPDAGEKQAVKTIPLLEDKWRQISAIYPHIQPFQDERDYLSIDPADFVMFTAASYRAANNSFLLHGYYNYKHLILTRVEQRGEILYYLGVPGNYYAREKQVAVIFGFESFECAEEPAQDGDFGYYLMRVQL